MPEVFTHRNDPNTSFAAADGMEQGKAHRHRMAVLRMIAETPDKTAWELSQWHDGLDRMQIIRRIADLKRDGAIVPTVRRVTDCEARGAYGYRVTILGMEELV